MCSLRFLHLNCQKAIAAVSQLAHDVMSENVDIASLNEPYVNRGLIPGTPSRWTQVHSGESHFRAALWVSARVSFCVLVRQPDVVAIRCRFSGLNVLVISCYCPPAPVDIQSSLDALDDLLKAFPNDQALVVGDFNARSSLWSPRPTNPRGRALILFASNANLEIINDPASPPTLVNSRGQGWIDILLVRYCVNRIADWTISEVESLSDHKVMKWNFLGKPDSRHPRGTSRRWNPRTLNWRPFLHDLKNLDLTVYDHATPDRGLEHLKSSLDPLCRKHSKRISVSHKGAVWWTTSLSCQRSRLRALRRLVQNELEPSRKLRLQILFRRKRAEYKRSILRAKRESFRRFISEGLASDRFGQIVDVVKGKWKREAPVTLVLASGEEVSTFEETQTVLAQHHFTTADDVTQVEIRKEGEPNLFTLGELEYAAESLHTGKAPGHDGFSLDIVRAVLKYHPAWLLKLYNHCLRESSFPRSWKRALAVYFPKAGKDRGDPGSYRPICLLSAFGKILDKMCAMRITSFLDSIQALDDRQYGFRVGRSTIDALHNVMNFMEDSKRSKTFTCLLTLDFKSAFDSVRRCHILRILAGLGAEPYLLGLVEDFLTSRSVILTTGEHEYNVGVPQGSCLGPTLWLVVINDLLRRLPRSETWAVQAFADDIFIMARNRAVMNFAQLLCPTLSAIHDWAGECDLSFSYGKCCYTIVPPKGKYRHAPSRPVLMSGHKISFKWSVKYLGVTFDANHSWMPHLDIVQEKAFQVQRKMLRVTTANWGLSSKMRKMVYSAVVEKIVLYAASIWYTDIVTMRRRLSTIQRGLLLGVTKCYSTVSTAALQVLAGVLPLYIRAKMDQEYFGLTRWNLPVPFTELDPSQVELWRPTPRCDDLWRIRWTMDLTPRSRCRYYTDGSKQKDNTVGSAFVAVNDEGVFSEGVFRLSDGANVFAAEVHAIKEAIEDALKRGLGELDIYSDSRSALQALYRLVPQHRAVAEIRDLVKQRELIVHAHWIPAHKGHVYNERADELAKSATRLQSVSIVVSLTRQQAKKTLLRRAVWKWQTEWVNGDTGRLTHELFPRVRLGRIQGDFYINQVFSGHGSFGDHQARFFHRDPTCFCGLEVSTIRHCLYSCPLWKDIRQRCFPWNYWNLSVRDLCLDGYCRKGVREIVSDLLLRTMARNLGRLRSVPYSRTLRVNPRRALAAL